MARRLLSHLLITLAIFSLSATYFIWVVDTALLNPTKLTKALREGGVPSALANIIPEQASKGNEDNNCNQSNQQNNLQQNSDPQGNNQQSNIQPGSVSQTPNQTGNPQQNGKQNGCQPKVLTEQDKKDRAEMKAKIASVVTPQYIDQKLLPITTSIINFTKNGGDALYIDLSDFPAKLRAAGVDAGGDIDKNFKDPIKVDVFGNQNGLHNSYKLIRIAKYAGVVLFVLFLAAEWFVAARGNKLHLIGRIFLHAAFWYTLWWILLVGVLSSAIPVLKEKTGADASIGALIEAIIKSIQHLFSVYFLGFAIVCWVFAIALYLARHSRKHVGIIQAVPAAKGKPKATPKNTKSS